MTLSGEPIEVVETNGEAPPGTKPYFRSIAEIERLVTGFEDGSLPKLEWTHQAHMTVAFWYLSKYSEAEATNLIRGGIKKYNQAVGTKNTETSGYHETIT